MNADYTTPHVSESSRVGPGSLCAERQDPHASVVLPGWTDVTSLFCTACDRLSLGKTVHVPGYTMLDTMGSIEVMEHRTDNGMAPDASILLPPEEMNHTSAPFDPFRACREYTAHDIVFILDRLLASQVAFHEASPLSVTIYPCLWLQPQHASHFSSCIAQPALADDPARQSLLLALAAACSATLTSANMVYQELVKYNVVEMEDFTSDKAGLSILDSALTSTAAIANLQRAQQRLQTFSSDPQLGQEAVDSICIRLSLLAHLVCIEALLANMPFNILSIKSQFDQEKATFVSDLNHLLPSRDTHTSELPLAAALGSNNVPIWPLNSPNLRDAPSVHAARTFDVWTYRRLISPVPVRPRVLPSPNRIVTFLSDFVVQLQDIVSRLLLPGSPDDPPNPDEGRAGFPLWLERLSHAPLALSTLFSEQARDIPGYVRSLQLTSLCSSAQGYAVNASRTLEWFGDSFLMYGAGTTIDDLSKLLYVLDSDDKSTSATDGPFCSTMAASLGENTLLGIPPRPSPFHDRQQLLGPRLRDVLVRLPGLIIADLIVLGQNPSRAHRKLKSCKDLIRLTINLTEITEAAIEYSALAHPYVSMLKRIQGAIIAFVQLLAIHVPLLGLQLELYPSSKAESDAPSAPACAAWLVSTLAQKRAETLEQVETLWPVPSEFQAAQDTEYVPDIDHVKRERRLMLSLSSFMQACYLMTFVHGARRIIDPAPKRPFRPTPSSVRSAQLKQRFHWLNDSLMGFALGFAGPGHSSLSAMDQYEQACSKSRELVQNLPSLQEAVVAALRHAQEHAHGADASHISDQRSNNDSILFSLAHGRTALARAIISHAGSLIAHIQTESLAGNNLAGASILEWTPGAWVPTVRLH